MPRSPRTAVELQTERQKADYRECPPARCPYRSNPGPAQVPCRYSIGEEQDHAGEETGFHDTEQEAQDVEAGRPLDEHEGLRRRCPRSP